MNRDKIFEILKKNKRIIFGPKMNGKEVYYTCIDFDPNKKTLVLHTDVGFKMHKKLEELIKILGEKFQVYKYFIEIIDIGKMCLDLDISLDIKNFENEKISEIIWFIKDNFYETKTWILLEK